MIFAGSNAVLLKLATRLICFGMTITNSWRKLLLLFHGFKPAALNSAAIKSAALSISGLYIFLPRIASDAKTLSIRCTSLALITASVFCANKKEVIDNNNPVTINFFTLVFYIFY